MVPSDRSHGNEELEPLGKLLRILSSPWTMLLLHRLHIEGPRRFGELKRRLGRISTKTLTERLRMLEAEGWVARHYEPTVPPQVTYSITPRVLELDSVMVELDRIAQRWYGSGSVGTAPPEPPAPEERPSRAPRSKRARSLGR